MKIILAYSGGLDTSVILTWLKQNYDAEIIAFCADVGQEEELDGLTEKALRTGAAKCIIEDLREEFARDFIFPCFRRVRFTRDNTFLGRALRVRSLRSAWSRLRAQNKPRRLHMARRGRGMIRFVLSSPPPPWRQN